MYAQGCTCTPLYTPGGDLVKALPTIFQATTFRSRLEADWAATLSDRDIPWVYEPEGYQLSDGTYYSPDFWLPSAQAWLEVKGSHMQRMTKVHQFAADLWAESGATSTYDTGAPMVLLGREPLQPDEILQIESLNLLGVMGPGKAYSVATVHCPGCGRGTVIALWQPSCRGCGHIVGQDNGAEGWIDSVEGGWWSGFKRVPRPAGRR